MRTDPPLIYLIVIMAALSQLVTTGTLLLLGADIRTALGMGILTAIGGALFGWLWARGG